MAVGGPTPSRPSGFFILIYLSPLLAAMSGLVISIGQFGGLRWAYYASIVFWIVLLPCFGRLVYVFDFRNGVIFLREWVFNFHGFLIFLGTVTPLIYNLGSLIYFLTKTPRFFLHGRALNNVVLYLFNFEEGEIMGRFRRSVLLLFRCLACRS
jgi:hypothetical protein